MPLNNEALSVLLERRETHREYVFTFKGNPVTQCNTKAFRNALKRPNIKDFKWHDLRHTWASWMIQAGVSVELLQELGGWESREMVMRYAHLSKDHLIDAIQKQKKQARRPIHNLLILLCFLWCRRKELNPRPSDYKSAALPTELHRPSSARKESIIT